MKQTLLIFFLFAFGHLGLSQHIQESYAPCLDFVCIRDDIDPFFCFYKNGTYVLTLSHVDSHPLLEDEDGNMTYSEFIFDNLWSYGNYVIDSNTIILTDLIHNYVMSFKLQDSQMFPLKTLKFLEYRKFCRNRIFTDADSAGLEAEDFNFNQSEIELYNRQTDSVLLFKPGIYGNLFEDGFLYRYSFSSNGNYSISWYGTTLSEGTWKRTHNALILEDSSHHFYWNMLIGDNCIIQKWRTNVFIPLRKELE